MTSGADDLLSRFLRLTQRPLKNDDPERPVWMRVWALFVDHPWFQEQLDWCASWAVRNRPDRSQLVDDVKQEVAFGLAQKLQWRADLNFKRENGSAEFARWLRTVLIRDCRLALARQRRPPTEPLVDPPASQQRQSCIELWDSVETLPPKDRPVVALYLKGYSYRDIERELDRSYWTVRRIVLRWAQRHYADEPTTADAD